ncbi:MAG: FmdB family zinc ribbon protein [Thermincolia bacterium]
MPTYDYQCEKCSRKFSELVKYEERDEVLCPECKEKAKRLISGFAVGRTSSSCPQRDACGSAFG